MVQCCGEDDQEETDREDLLMIRDAATNVDSAILTYKGEDNDGLDAGHGDNWVAFRLSEGVVDWTLEQSGTDTGVSDQALVVDLAAGRFRVMTTLL